MNTETGAPRHVSAQITETALRNSVIFLLYGPKKNFTLFPKRNLFSKRVGNETDL